jgi:predicted phage terminase large subunit-like protein
VTFAKAVAPGYEYARHLLAINEQLLHVTAGRVKRLMICMPPRHGKSYLTSQYFPAWFLGRYPDRKIILAAYEAQFAAGWGRKARDVLTEWGPQVFNAHVSNASSAADQWETTAGGGMSTAGVGGALTGKGAHVLIIDDPVKNSEEAHSKVIREKIWEWYLSTALTRLEPDGSAILIMTRWHEDDLAGRLLKNEGDQWTKLILPAISPAGDPLFAKRFDLTRLNGIRKSLGSYFWNALYMQNPTPPDGGIFKKDWWRFWTRLPDRYDRVVMSWDCTFKESGSSYVVGQVWGKKGSESHLIDMVRGKWDFPETMRQIRALRERHPNTSEILIEEKANGAAIISSLRREIPGIIPITPTESKEARASAVSHVVEAGNVLLPLQSQYTTEAIAELTAFPNGENDDIVDALTQAINRLYNRPQIRAGLAAF